MSREGILLVLAAIVAVELALYYCYRSSQGFREKLAKLKTFVEPGALLIDVGRGLSPRRAGRALRYALLAISATSLAVSAYLFYSIVLNYVIDLVTSIGRGEPAPQSPIVPVIPGITFGLNILLPLLISIGIGLAAHEVLHMVVALVNGVPVESWGIGLALIFPVAYVRVSEESFSRSKLEVKASVLCAGIMANVVVGLLSLALAGLAAQPLAPYLDGPHLMIVGVDPAMPAGRAGLVYPSILEEINGSSIRSLDELRETLNRSLDRVAVFRFRVRPLVDTGVCGFYRASELSEEYLVTRSLGDVEKYGYRVGIVVAPSSYTFSSATPSYLLYANCQLQLLYIVNISLAIFNSAPLIITDGGKLLSEVLKKVGAQKLDRVVQWSTVALTAITISIGLAQAL
ncbi:MAG: M50 family metallopeptidase [Sulfolobales archaeon]|nr:M50 family metallopeptidase [Sulfolobales archaeon]MCX8208402.1 M50 family metallopeptidase [Sulfolobales archaeon]MDW8010906.1 M50 family metallopeptidase [Sulfolobales archaeon]